MVNCVSVSTAAQHIEAPINANNNQRLTKAGIVVKINIFAPSLKFQADFCIAHRFAWGWISFIGGIGLDKLCD